MNHRKSGIVMGLLLLLASWTLTGCEAVIPLDEEETAALLDSAIERLSDPDYDFFNYVIECETSHEKRIVQKVRGFTQYLEETESYTKFDNGHPYIIENGVKREDADAYDFKDFKNEARAILDIGVDILQARQIENITGWMYDGLISDGPEWVDCQIKQECIAEFGFDKSFDKATLQLTASDKGVFNNLEIRFESSNGDHIVYEMGVIDGVLMIDFPDDE